MWCCCLLKSTNVNLTRTESNYLYHNEYLLHHKWFRVNDKMRGGHNHNFPYPNFCWCSDILILKTFFTPTTHFSTYDRNLSTIF
jgi:hypothetical protein